MTKRNESNVRENEKAGMQSEKANENPPRKKHGGLLSYFRGVRQEMEKVVWPERGELAKDTVVVFGVCLFFAVAFWAMDTGFLAALRELLGITLS